MPPRRIRLAPGPAIARHRQARARRHILATLRFRLSCSGHCRSRSVQGRASLRQPTRAHCSGPFRSHTGAGTGDWAAPAGGGTGTVGGADTAPINAAGDSRTRKAAEGGPPAAGSPGAAVAQQVHDFWISKGFSEAQTAGIMAGGPGSESDFTPTVFGDKGTFIRPLSAPRATAGRHAAVLRPLQLAESNR